MRISSAENGWGFWSARWSSTSLPARRTRLPLAASSSQAAIEEYNLVAPLWCRPAEVAEGPLAIDVSAAVKVELIERAVLGLQGCLASPFVHRASDA